MQVRIKHLIGSGDWLNARFREQIKHTLAYIRQPHEPMLDSFVHASDAPQIRGIEAERAGEPAPLYRCASGGEQLLASTQSFIEAVGDWQQGEGNIVLLLSTGLGEVLLEQFQFASVASIGCSQHLQRSGGLLILRLGEGGCFELLAPNPTYLLL